MALEVANFDKEVLEKSHESPVLVDFWAPWCGPCRVLGPILDKLAAENSSEWILAKLNTDEYPEVSMRYGIRGIPAVKLFVDGEVTAEFTGSLPEFQVKKWLDENIPSADSGSLAYAASLVGEGRFSEARALLEDLDSDEAKVLLARMIVFTDPVRASELSASVEAVEFNTRSIVDAVREVASVLAPDASSLPVGPGREAFADVVSHLRSGQFDEAASGIITVLQTDRLYGDDAARKLGIALFTLLGPEDEVTRKHRRMFDMYLY
jgi:putative thioredoxin